MEFLDRVNFISHVFLENLKTSVDIDQELHLFFPGECFVYLSQSLSKCQQLFHFFLHRISKISIRLILNIYWFCFIDIIKINQESIIKSMNEWLII